MESFDIIKTSNAVENNVFAFKNLKRVFLARRIPARTAEFSPCRSSPPGNSENMTTAGASFGRTPKPATFGHGNDDDRHSSDAMGQRDLEAPQWMLHHCLLPVLEA